VTGIQLLAIAAAALMLFVTYNGLRRNELRRAEFGVWTGTWLLLILVSLFPQWLRNVIGPLQVARLLDLVIIAGIVMLAAILLGLNRDLRRTENRLAELVRKLAEEAERSAHEEPGRGREG